MADRMLVFSGIGAMALLAMVVRDAVESLANGHGGRSERALVSAVLLVHLVLPAGIIQARIAGISAYAEPVNSALEALEGVPDLDRKTVVLVNAPNALQATSVPRIRRAQGLPIPRHTYTLAPDTGVPIAITFRRSGERSLDVLPSRPFAWWLWRDNVHPFEVGDVVRLTGIQVRIVETTARGEPIRIEATFTEALESEQFVWLEYSGGSYARFAVPAVGTEVSVP
jgi:hypothetical protein